MPNLTKEFIPSVTQDDLLEWREQMALVRRLYIKGKWPNGKETLMTMQEIYDSMKVQFATGDGIYIYSRDENNNASQGIQGQVISIGG